MVHYGYVVLLPRHPGILEDSMDLIAEWCGGSAITTLTIVNTLIPTMGLSDEAAMDYIETHAVDPISVVNGNMDRIDPVHDYVNRATLVDEYMNVRELFIEPLYKACPTIRSIISLVDNGVSYGIKYSSAVRPVPPPPSRHRTGWGHRPNPLQNHIGDQKPFGRW